LDRSQLKLGIWGGKILEKPVFVARFENWCWMMQMRVWCKYTCTCLMRITLLCWKMTTDFKHEFWHRMKLKVENYFMIWFDFWCLTPLSAIFQLYIPVEPVMTHLSR
jgi:hypothetical protein